MRASLGLLALCGLGMGCRTIETTRPVHRAPHVRTASATRMFSVEHGGSARGFVVLFESQASPTDAVYVVQNVHQQDLGVIDSLGRAFRYLPHENEPRWLGSGSIARGVQRILNTRAVPEMHELDLPETPTASLTSASAKTTTDSQTKR